MSAAVMIGAAEVAELRGPGSSFLPGSAAHASAEACLDHLQGPEYVLDLVDAIVQCAGDAQQTVSELRKVDALVELLDSELAYGGHSRTWRATAVEDLKRRTTEDAEPLETALPGALENALCGKARDFEVVILLDDMGEPDQAPTWMQDVASTSEVILSWPPNGREEALRVVESAQRTVRTKVTAVDSASALREADDSFRRLRNIWRLRDNELPYPEKAIVYDPELRLTTVASLPSEPLDVAPNGLESWTAGAGTSVLDAAIDQLAQARNARPSAAFVDLWTAAESLYGGGVEDRRYKAGLVMARMAEYSYIADSHVWLARRADAADVGRVPQGGELDWFMGTLGTRDGARKLSEAFTTSGDQVAWVRFKAMSGWDRGWGLRNELDLLHDRLHRVVDRAYLIRNFAVHRADESLPTLNVVLPTFAALVQVCVGMSIRRSQSGRGPLTEAKAAALTARAVAEDFGRGRSNAPEGLGPALQGA